MRSHLIFVWLWFVCSAGVALAEVRTGAYRGDGVAGRGILVGFQPAVVIVKGNDTDVNDDLTSAVIRSSTMGGDTSKPLKGDQPPAANLIQALGPNGFTVGSDRKVNSAGITYYWVAFEANPNLKMGTYVGNGVGQSLTAVGFSPDYVVLLASNNRRAVQRPASAPASYQFWAGSSYPDAVVSLDPDGFTVAGSNFANEAGVTYHYLAWNAVAGQMTAGAYVGSGTDNRGIATPGFHPQYLLVRTSTNTQDPFQRMRVHSGDASIDFRGGVQANRIQRFETTGFQVGTDTRVNTAGDTYFYVAFGDCASCRNVTTTESGATVSVNASRSFQVKLDAVVGGGITELTDLVEDPAGSIDLAGGAGAGDLLFDEAILSGGVWYSLDRDTEGRVEVLEATTARARVRQTARPRDPAGALLVGPRTTVDHSVYPSGKIALDWNRWIQTQTAVPFETNDRDLNLHLQAAPPLDAWSPFSQSGALGVQPGGDDFLLARIDGTAAAGPGARTDLLFAQSIDWNRADSTGVTATPANQRENLYWTDGTAGSFPAGSTETWAALAYVKPTDLADAQDPKATSRVLDYRSPAVPALAVGNGWFSPSENTALPGDFFNEAEGAYDLTFDGSNGLDFTIDGSTVPRFDPFLKIRGWRSLSPTPDVTLIRAELAWRASEQTGDVAPLDDVSSTDETHRVILRAPFLTRGGTELRLRLRANSTQPVTMSGFHLAETDPADDRNVVDATFTPVTFGGSASVTIPAGGSAWSDWVAFSVDESKSYAVSYYIDSVQNGTKEWTGAGTQKYILFGNQSSVADWSAAAPAPSNRIDALEEVELRGSLLLAGGGDYLADVKPVSRGGFAQDLVWYSTLQDAASINAPDVGSPGTVNGAVAYGQGRYGNGIELDADGEYIVLPASDVLNTAAGAFEAWYRPSYDFGTGTTNDDDALFGYWIDNTHYFYFFHEPNVSGIGDNDGLNFDARDGSATTNVVTGAGPGFPSLWRANEWVHLRATWDIGSATVQIFVNGTLVASGPYAGAPALPADNRLFLGDRNRFGSLTNHARGTLDEVYFYSSAAAPSALARGGLTASAQEQLGTASRNFQFSFGAVDALSRGEYLFLGTDSQFSGLNIDLAVYGAGVSAGALEWEYWSNASGWKSLEVPGFTDETSSLTRRGTVYWPDLPDWDPYSLNAGPELYTLRVHLKPLETYSTFPTESMVKTDVLLFQYCDVLTRIDARFVFGVPPPTAVELETFQAVPGNRRITLEWRTASEMQNLGFHLYRGLAETGPFEKLTDVMVPGLGSSPEGAGYRFVDQGVENGTEYFYFLEDIESTGRTERHGPVRAIPSADLPDLPYGGAAGDGSGQSRALITLGDPSANRFIVHRRSGGADVELIVQGFTAEPLEDGTVRISLPGLEAMAGDEGLPSVRRLVDVLAGRRVELASTNLDGFSSFSLRPAGAPDGDVVGLANGTVSIRPRALRGRPIPETPWDAVSLGQVVFLGLSKKVPLELRPLHWDGARSELRLARRIRARLSWGAADRAEVSGDGVRGRRERRNHSSVRRGVVARLGTREPGIYAISFEELRPWLGSARSASTMRLSRLGRSIAFHLEPQSARFGPGSTLYFVSEGARANPYGEESLFELELGAPAELMPIGASELAGESLSRYWYRLEREENRLYQAALVQAPDPWLWDYLISPARRSYPFALRDFDPTGGGPQLEVFLQGASDSPANPDHHARAYVNGILVGETFWEGKLPFHWTLDIPDETVREGENELEISNVGDTGAPFSAFLLDRFALTYSRLARLDGSQLEGTWGLSGTAQVANVQGRGFVVDVGSSPFRWISARADAGTLRFRSEAGHRYWMSPENALRAPSVHPASMPTLKRERSRTVEYLVVGPRELLETAAPLLAQRRRQGLRVAVASTEQIYDEFGYGEERPEAIRDFLSHAYHHWGAGSLRYVVLLGDATYDFKDNLATGVRNQLPPLMMKTRWLWTVSDPTYGAVNGDDLLPDVAVGRLPAANPQELRVMVEKILAYEAAGTRSSRIVLVADNPDAAGDFEADAEEIAESLLRGLEVERIYVRSMGAAASRAAVRAAFDRGAAVMSYVGHGGIHLWASENLLDLEAVDGLAQQGVQPIALSINCLNGYFHFPYFDSLSERLVEARGKGAIAAFAPSGFSWDQPAHQLHRALLQELLGRRHQRLGDAFLEAQTQFAETGAEPELLEIFHLLGDPALVLR